MIGITGSSSSIAQKFIENYCEENVITARNAFDLPLDCDEYLLCAGVLYGKKLNELSDFELDETIRVNFINVVKFCDKVFACNDKAKVCIIGSESGIKGSYDMAYAGAKAALHLYVETKQLQTKDQHLVCVSPTIIADSGMTERRKDLKAVLERGDHRRLGRWLTATEVARVADFALSEMALSNTVIRVTGGNW